MKVVRVILRDWFEIPSASRPQISEYRRSIRLHFALALSLVYGHSRSARPTEPAASHSEDELAPRSAESDLAAPLAS